MVKEGSIVSVEHFPVEAGHILTFARAIGDDNPVYRDEEAALAAGLGGIIAPPTFVVAGAHFDPDYPLRPAPGKPWFGSGREATGAPAPGVQGRTSGEGTASGETSLHAEQHFEYHRTLRAGDVLTSSSHSGSTWQKEGRRGGTMTFSEFVTEYRDADGSPVVTARTVSVRISRPAED
jgi:hypothetical protein